ncbi:MAG: MFS transporter [Francisellaceae bacterium]
MSLKRFYPILIPIPAFGVGVYWALAGTFAPWIAYTQTDNDFLVMLLISMGPFTGIFTQYLAGMISDRTTSRFGRRTPWIIAGVILACLSQIMWFFAPNFIMLFMIGFLTYFAVNFFQGPYFTMIYEVVPKNRIGFATVMSKFIMGSGGMIISFFSAMIWKQGVLFSVIIIALFMAVPMLILMLGVVKEAPVVKGQMQVPKKLQFDLLSHPRALQLFIAVLFLYLATGPINAIMTPYFVKYIGFSKETLAQALGLGGLIGLLATGSISFFIDRFNPKRLFQGILVFNLVVFLVGTLISSSQQLVLFYVFNVLIGIMGVSYPIIFTLLPRVAPEGRLGEFQGLLNMFLSIGDFAMTLGIGLLLESGHNHWVLKIEMVLVSIAFLIMLPNFKGGAKTKKTVMEKKPIKQKSKDKKAYV